MYVAAEGSVKLISNLCWITGCIWLISVAGVSCRDMCLWTTLNKNRPYMFLQRTSNLCTSVLGTGLVTIAVYKQGFGAERIVPFQGTGRLCSWWSFASIHIPEDSGSSHSSDFYCSSPDFFWWEEKMVLTGTGITACSRLCRRVYLKSYLCPLQHACLWHAALWDDRQG